MSSHATEHDSEHLRQREVDDVLLSLDSVIRDLWITGTRIDPYDREVGILFKDLSRMLLRGQANIVLLRGNKDESKD